MSGYGRGGSRRDGAAAAYRQSRVLSGNRVELVVMLYERLLADLRGAAIAMRAGDIQGKTAKVQRATDVIFELLSTLDRADGGEVTERLAALYSYMISRIGQASRSLDPAALEEVAGHVESLHAAWAEIARDSSVFTSAPPPPGR